MVAMHCSIKESSSNETLTKKVVLLWCYGLNALVLVKGKDLGQTWVFSSSVYINSALLPRSVPQLDLAFSHTCDGYSERLPLIYIIVSAGFWIYIRRYNTATLLFVFFGVFINTSFLDNVQKLHTSSWTPPQSMKTLLYKDMNCI